MSVAIVGYGIVGKAYNKIFPDAVLYDKETIYLDNGDMVLSVKADVNACKLAIVCVPTPFDKETDECDISAVETCVKWIESDVILIKSAIPPGATDYLRDKYKKRVVVSPEYVGESKYYIPDKYLDPTDPRKHGFQTFGGYPDDTQFY